MSNFWWNLMLVFAIGVWVYMLYMIITTFASKGNPTEGEFMVSDEGFIIGKFKGSKLESSLLEIERNDPSMLSKNEIYRLLKNLTHLLFIQDTYNYRELIRFRGIDGKEKKIYLSDRNERFVVKYDKEFLNKIIYRAEEGIRKLKDVALRYMYEDFKKTLKLKYPSFYVEIFEEDLK